MEDALDVFSSAARPKPPAICDSCDEGQQILMLPVSCDGLPPSHQTGMIQLPAVPSVHSLTAQA